MEVEFVGSSEVYTRGLRALPLLRERDDVGNFRPWWIQIPTLILIFVNVFCILFIMGYSSGRDIFVLGVLGCLFLNVDYAIIQMWNASIAGTISGTVAQRYHPVAYYTIISLTALVYFVAALITFGFANPMSKMEWFYICFEVLGLVLLSLVLVFPATVHMRSSDDLHMTPSNWFASEMIFNTTYFHYLMIFNVPMRFTDSLHGIAFFVGWLMCEAAMLVYIVENGLNLIYKKFVLICMSVSFIFMVIFLCLRYYSNRRQSQELRRARNPEAPAPDPCHDELWDLVVEVMVVYALIFGLVGLSFGASDSLPFIVNF